MRIPVKNVNATDRALFAKIGARWMEVMDREDGIDYIDVDTDYIAGVDPTGLETSLQAALLSWKAAIAQERSKEA